MRDYIEIWRDLCFLTKKTLLRGSEQLVYYFWIYPTVLRDLAGTLEQTIGFFQRHPGRYTLKFAYDGTCYIDIDHTNLASAVATCLRVKHYFLALRKWICFLRWLIIWQLLIQAALLIFMGYRVVFTQEQGIFFGLEIVFLAAVHHFVIRPLPEPSLNLTRRSA